MRHEFKILISFLIQKYIKLYINSINIKLNLKNMYYNRCLRYLIASIDTNLLQ